MIDKTKIRYYLPQKENVKLTVYGGTGHLVKDLIDKEMPCGMHVIDFSKDELPSGMYYFILKTNENRLVKKS